MTELALYARLPLWFTVFLRESLGRRLVFQPLPGEPPGFNRTLNPLRLGLARRPQAALVTWDLHQRLVQEGAEEMFYRALHRLHLPIVGIENQDLFHLKFLPQDCARFDLILKAQGVYHDLDLYNYRVGGRYGSHWTEKAVRLDRPYRREDLAKLRPSFPVFVVRMHALKRLRAWMLRTAAGLLAAGRPADRAVCFFAAMNHVRRFQTLRVLQDEQIPFAGGLVNHGEINIAGHEEILGRRHRSLDVPALYEEIAARDLWVERVGAWRYARALRRSRAVLGIAGHGELGVRHADAFEHGRLLICQDLNHARVLYPLKPGENVVYCAPDLRDLAAILKDLTGANAAHYRRIAARGLADWRAWCAEREAVLDAGLWQPLRELQAGAAPSVRNLEDRRIAG